MSNVNVPFCANMTNFLIYQKSQGQRNINLSKKDMFAVISDIY